MITNILTRTALRTATALTSRPNSEVPSTGSSSVDRVSLGGSANQVTNDVNRMRAAAARRNRPSTFNRVVDATGNAAHAVIGGVERLTGGGRVTDLRAIDRGTLVPDRNSRLGAYHATRGYEEGTVGHAAHSAIGTLYTMMGTAGEERIGTVFNSSEARALYNDPVNSSSSRRLATMEVNYWNQMRDEKGSFGGHLGSMFNPEVRDWLQREWFR